MNELALLLDEYLATRRALGTRLELPGRLLKRFVMFTVSTRDCARERSCSAGALKAPDCSRISTGCADECSCNAGRRGGFLRP